MSDSLQIPDAASPAEVGAEADGDAPAPGDHSAAQPRHGLDALSPTATAPPSSPGVFLRAYEQRILAMVVMILLATGGWIWWQRGGSSQVEYERRPQLPVSYRVDINTCGWPELAQVSGIGETLARRIVELRSERGGFRHASEIMDVKGIGPKKFQELEAYLLPISSPATKEPRVHGSP